MSEPKTIDKEEVILTQHQFGLLAGIIHRRAREHGMTAEAYLRMSDHFIRLNRENMDGLVELVDQVDEEFYIFDAIKS